MRLATVAPSSLTSQAKQEVERMHTVMAPGPDVQRLALTARVLARGEGAADPVAVERAAVELEREVETLRSENARLLTEVERLTTRKAARRPAANGRTARENTLLAEGKPPFKGAIWFGHGHGWGIKRKRPVVSLAGAAVGAALPSGGVTAAYLAATGKASVPAHDPAFGRR